MIITFLGFSRQLEVLLIILTGICVLAFDSSLFHIKTNLEEIWNYEFDPQFCKNNVDLYLKYILSGVIFVRTFTLHIFLALYIVMLWPAIFEDRPRLMLPWLVLGSIRSIFVNIVTLATGSYVCITQKGFHPICLDFLLSQIIEHGPSVYAWFAILGYYQHLQQSCEETQRKPSERCELANRRNKAKTIGASELRCEEKMHKSSFRGYLSETIIDNLLHQLEHSDDFNSPNSRSLDSLLKAKLEKDFSQYDNVEEDECKNVSERVMELLNLTEEDIDKAKAKRKGNYSGGYRNKELRIGKSVSFKPSVDVKSEDQASNRLRRPVSMSLERLNRSKVVGKTSKCDCIKTSSRKTDMNEIELRTISFDKFYQTEDSSNKLNDPKVNVPDESSLCTEQIFLGNCEDITQTQKGKNTGCQVSTLKRSLLNLPPKEITKRFHFVKKIVRN